MSNQHPEDRRYQFERDADIDVKLINFAYPPSNNHRYARLDDWEIAKREWPRRSPPVSNITEERLALDEAIRAWARKTHSHSSWSESSGGKIGIDFSALRTLFTELQLLRASAPVLSEEQRGALEAGAKLLEIEVHAGTWGHVAAQAAILRAMAERGG